MGNETQHLYQCPYCTYIFFKYPSREDYRSECLDKKTGRGGSNSEQTADSPAKTDKSSSEETHLLVCPRCQSYINLKKLPAQEQS